PGIGPVPTPAPVLNTTGETPFRILIVEDDRPQALFAQSVLHGAGMQAEVEMRPEGVLEAIARFDPDLILMDLHMPGLDGMRLTGDPDPERQFEVLGAGADDFLSTPVRPRHLIAAVANRIQRARAQREQSVAPLPTLRAHPETGLATRGWLLQQIDEARQDQ